MNKKLFNEIKNMNFEEFQDFCTNILKARDHELDITFNFEMYNKQALWNSGNTSFKFLVLKLYTTYNQLITNYITTEEFAKLAASFISGSFNKALGMMPKD